MPMNDGSGELSEWGAYLRRMTQRPGWSVARLARESGIHRATIFDWMKGGGESVTIASVKAIARALGDDLENALRAVANISTPSAPADEEMDLIMSAPVSDDVKRRMIARLLEMREQDRQQRLNVMRWMISESAAEAGKVARPPEQYGQRAVNDR